MVKLLGSFDVEMHLYFFFDLLSIVAKDMHLLRHTDSQFWTCSDALGHWKVLYLTELPIETINMIYYLH